MSLAFHVTSTSGSIFPSLHHSRGLYPTTSCQGSFGFIYNEGFFQPSVLRFEKKPKFLKSALPLLHRVCKWRIGFSSVATNYGAASSFNYSESNLEDSGRKGGLRVKEAANHGGSDTNTCCGPGNSDSRGGGDKSGRGSSGLDGSGSGGLDESADWEGVKWWCWRFFQIWKDYTKSINLRPSVVGLSRFGGIAVKLEGIFGKMAESSWEEILLALLGPILPSLCIALTLPCVLLSIAVCAGILEEVLMLGCIIVLFLFWRS